MPPQREQRVEVSRLVGTIANWTTTALIGVLIWIIQDWKIKVENHLNQLNTVTREHSVKLAVIESRIDAVVKK